MTCVIIYTSTCRDDGVALNPKPCAAMPINSFFGLIPLSRDAVQCIEGNSTHIKLYPNRVFKLSTLVRMLRVVTYHRP